MRNFLGEGTHGATCTTGTVVADDGSTASSVSQSAPATVQFSNVHAQSFATSVRFNSTAATAGQIIRLPFSASTVTGAVRLYHYAASLPPVNWVIMTLRQAAAVSNRILINTDGSVSIASSSGTVLATTAAGAWAVNRWNRIGVWFDGSGATSTHDLFLAVYNADGVSATGTASRTNTTVTTPIVSVDIGQPVSNGIWEHWVDTVGLEVNVVDFLGPYVIPSASRSVALSGAGVLASSASIVPRELRTVTLSGSGTLSSTASQKFARSGTLSGSGTLTATVTSERHTRTVGLTGSGSLAGVATSRPLRLVALSGSGSLSAAVEILPFPVALSGSGELNAINVRGIVPPPPTFSYWEKRHKDFGEDSGSVADELKPFWYQSYPQGVTVVRYADGTYSTVEVVTEELESLDGVRIFYGGKENPVTDDELQELIAAGYIDYLKFSGYGFGPYGMGAYGVPMEGG